MKERPILFSAPMIRALLAGTKTVTRRLFKPKHDFNVEDGVPFFASYVYGEPESSRVPCPYGAAGDRLWCRETWQYADWTEDGHPYIRCAADDSRRLCERVPSEWSERLSSVWSGLSAPENFAIDGRAADRCWRPSIFMPRWASRITLGITEVRCERLQELTEVDAIAEGISFDGRWYLGAEHPIKKSPKVFSTACSAFESLWCEINGEDSWKANPWVWRVEFKHIQPESIATLIDRSSIGAGLRDIEERGIDAHLADLERQL